VPLRCGGRRFTSTALRWAGRRPARSGRQQRAGAVAHRPPPQLRRAPATTRSRVRALRHVAVVAGYRSDPAALRCSAPQRRSTRRPPAPLREPTVQLATVLLFELLGGACKAVGGRAAERLCGAEERRGTGVAHRPKAMRRAQPVRAPSTGSSRSEMPAVRGRVLRSPPGTDALSPDERQSLRTVFRLAKAKALASALARRAVDATRRPPQRSAAARPPTALQRPPRALQHSVDRERGKRGHCVSSLRTRCTRSCPSCW